MADRILVEVDVDSTGAVSGFRNVSGQATAFGRNLTSQGRSVSAFNSVLAQQQRNLQSVARAGRLTAGVITFALSAAFVDGVRKAIAYEQQMARVEAVLKANGAEMESLEKLAMRLGAQTKFSAGEAAEAMYQLASAGFTVEEMGGALKGTLDLAAASNIELADASEITANALRGFSLDADQATHVADVLAQAVNSSSVEMTDLQLTMKYIGPVAKATGQSFEEMVAAVSTMGDAGIKGEQAGTTLRASMLSLVHPIGQAKKALNGLGIDVADLQGPNGLLPLSEIVALLDRKTQDLTKAERSAAISRIFGREAASGMFAVLEAGAPKLDRLEQALIRSDGAAKDAATTMQDTVSGAWEQFHGSIETVEIALFKQFSEPLKDALLDATDTVNREGKEIEAFFDRVSQLEGFKEGTLSERLELIFGELDLEQRIADTVSDGIELAAEAVAENAPKVAAAFVRGFAAADVWGKLVIGGLLLSKLGLGGPLLGTLTKSGRTAGAQVGQQFQAGLAGALMPAAAGAGIAGFSQFGRRFQQTTSGILLPAGVAVGSQVGTQMGETMAQRSGSTFGSKFRGFIGRAGLIGAGLFVGDQILEGMSDSMLEGSDDLWQALAAKGNSTFFSDEFFGSSIDEMRGSKALTAILEAIADGRAQVTSETLASVRALEEELDLTSEQRAQVAEIVELGQRRLFQMQRLSKIGLDLDIDTPIFEKIIENFEAMHSGALSAWKDIRQVFRRNAKAIETDPALNGHQARKALAANFLNAAGALSQGLKNKTIPETKENLDRLRDFLRNYKLLSGKDPLGIAEGFAKEWKHAGEITKASIDDVLADLGKMPKPAREKAGEALIEYARGLADKKKIPEAEVDDFVSKLVSKFTDLADEGTDQSKNLLDGFMGSVDDLVKEGTTAIGDLVGIASDAMSAFGLDPIDFSVKKPKNNARGGVVEDAFARGGSIRPGKIAGAGVDDTVPLWAAPGEWAIANRHQAPFIERALAASREMGVQPFGSMGELFSGVQTPHYFAKGGFVGGPFQTRADVDNAGAGFVPFMNYVNSQVGPMDVISGLRLGSITTSGNPSNHGWGGAVDIAPPGMGDIRFGAPSSLVDRADAAHAMIGQRFSSVLLDFLWRTLTGGNHFNHIHVGIDRAFSLDAGAMSKYISGLPGGGHFGSLPKMKLIGPDGALTELGQAVINRVHKAGSRAVSQAMMTPGFGAYDLGDMHAPAALKDLDHVFPAHPLGAAGFAQLSEQEVGNIAGHVGLPSYFPRISRGESRHFPGVISSDGGHGLYQETPGAWNGDPVLMQALARIGGVTQLRNPIRNSAMAKAHYEHAGKSPGEAGFPWYGTQFLNKGGFVSGQTEGNVTPPGYDANVSGQTTGNTGSALAQILARQFFEVRDRYRGFISADDDASKALDIAERDAALPLSPLGSEYSGAEKHKLIGIHERKLGHLLSQKRSIHKLLELAPPIEVQIDKALKVARGKKEREPLQDLLERIRGTKTNVSSRLGELLGTTAAGEIYGEREAIKLLKQGEDPTLAELFPKVGFRLKKVDTLTDAVDEAGLLAAAAGGPGGAETSAGERQNLIGLNSDLLAWLQALRGGILEALPKARGHIRDDLKAELTSVQGRFGNAGRILEVQNALAALKAPEAGDPFPDNHPLFAAWRHWQRMRNDNASRTDWLDERIQIDTELAGEAGSPGGTEVAPGERSQLLTLNRQRLQRLVNQRNFAQKTIDEGARLRDVLAKRPTPIHEREAVDADITRLSDVGVDMAAVVTNMQGVTGKGGLIFGAQQAIRELIRGGLPVPPDPDPDPDPEPENQDAELAALYKQKAREAIAERDLIRAQMPDFLQFFQGARLPYVGAFARGGQIPRTGMAVVHRDEMITPDPEGPFGSQVSGRVRGGDSPVVVELVLKDKAGALVELIDARVDGRAAQVANKRLGREARVRATAPGF